MPRRTSHPISTLLRVLGWAGSSGEMTTPLGDTLQPVLQSDRYDPPYVTYGIRAITALPPVGEHARLRIFFDRDVLAYRIRGLSGGAGSWMLRSINLVETADPIANIAPFFASRAVEPPFRVRNDAGLPAAVLPEQGWRFGGLTGGVFRGDQIWADPIWTESGQAFEVVSQTINQVQTLHLMLDVLRTA